MFKHVLKNINTKISTGITGEMYKPRYRYNQGVGKSRKVLGMR